MWDALTSLAPSSGEKNCSRLSVPSIRDTHTKKKKKLKQATGKIKAFCLFQAASECISTLGPLPLLGFPLFVIIKASLFPNEFLAACTAVTDPPFSSARQMFGRRLCMLLLGVSLVLVLNEALQPLPALGRLRSKADGFGAILLPFKYKKAPQDSTKSVLPFLRDKAQVVLPGNVAAEAPKSRTQRWPLPRLLLGGLRRRRPRRWGHHRAPCQAAPLASELRGRDISCVGGGKWGILTNQNGVPLFLGRNHLAK